MRRLIVLIALLFAASVTSAACTAPPTQVPTPSVRSLVSDNAQQDALTPQDTTRAWQFAGVRGEPIHLKLDAKTQSGAQITLILQDAAGNPLAQGDDLRLTLPADGTYLALVRYAGDSMVTYSIALATNEQAVSPTPTDTPSPTLTPSPTQTFTPTSTFTPTFTPSPTFTPTPIYAPYGTLKGRLDLDVPVEGTYLSQFERHIYLFAGSAGQQITISMTKTSGEVDPRLTLYDPAGQAIATDDDSGAASSGGNQNALLQNIRLTVDGDYIIQALGGSTGSYQIGVQAEAQAPPIALELPTPTATPPLGTSTPTAYDAAPDNQLVDHVPRQGVIDRPGAFGRYFIAAEAGDLITIGVRPVGESLVIPHVEIYNPAGELMLATNSDASGAVLIPGFGVIESGSYAVFVSDAGRGGGAYSIAYGEGETHTDDLHGVLPADVPVVGGTIAGVRVRWTLALNAGDQISVEAENAQIEIDAQGTASRGENSLSFDAPQSGDYTLYTSASSPYTLTWHLLVAAPTPVPAQVVLILSATDPLPPQTYVDYPFQGSAGERVHVHVEALSDGLDPVAVLLDANGSTIAQGDDSADSLDPDFETTLPSDGTYWLRVNAYSTADDAVGGNVRVTVEMLS